jgi:transposase
VVDETQQYSAAEMERMMKVQDVLLKAMAKKITWWAAAEILGVTDRTMRRWRSRLEKGGYSGLADRRRGKPSAQRIPLAMVEQVLGLYKETYYDLNIRHFQKLRDKHDIELSYTWVQKALQGAGLVAKRHKRGTVEVLDPEDQSRTGEDGRGGRCLECCCTLTAANTGGSATTGGMT